MTSMARADGVLLKNERAVVLAHAEMRRRGGGGGGGGGGGKK